MGTPVQGRRRGAVGFPVVEGGGPGLLAEVECLTHPDKATRGTVTVLGGTRDGKVLEDVLADSRYGELRHADLPVRVDFSPRSFTGDSYMLAFAIADKRARFGVGVAGDVPVIATGALEKDGRGKLLVVDGLESKLRIVLEHAAPGTIFVFPAVDEKQWSDGARRLTEALTRAGVRLRPCARLDDLSDLWAAQAPVVSRVAASAFGGAFWVGVGIVVAAIVLVLLIGRDDVRDADLELPEAAGRIMDDARHAFGEGVLRSTEREAPVPVPPEPAPVAWPPADLSTVRVCVRSVGAASAAETVSGLRGLLAGGPFRVSSGCGDATLQVEVERDPPAERRQAIGNTPWVDVRVREELRVRWAPDDSLLLELAGEATGAHPRAEQALRQAAAEVEAELVEALRAFLDDLEP